MNIGEEEEAIEMPIPLAPGQTPVHEPSPQTAPAEEPAEKPEEKKIGRQHFALPDAFRCFAHTISLGFRTSLRRGGATPGEFAERRQALTGVMASAHQVLWRRGPSGEPGLAVPRAGDEGPRS